MADELIELLARVSGALGIMTRIVMKLDGVVGDFHGDAAMGFWGWPLEQSDTASVACQAAIEIQKELALIGQGQSALSGFHMGIGIATGAAVAGKIGTSDQVKVTVFGPVVNLASRLESLTRLVGANVLLDRATAEQCASYPELTTQLLMKVKPYGLQSATEVYRLVLAHDQFDKGYLGAYAAALADLSAGNWSAAQQQFDQLASHDSVSKFLLNYIHRFRG